MMLHNASCQDRTNRRTGKYAGTDVCWRDDAGQQRSKRFQTRAEAESYRERIQCGTADTSPAARAAVLFGDFVRETWLPHAISTGKMADSTRRAILATLNNDLAELNTRSLAWVATHPLEVERMIAASKRVDHGGLHLTVKSGCDAAVYPHQLITAHALHNLNVKRSDKIRDIIPTTAEQRKYIADGLGTRGIAVYLCHGLGLRIGECLGLRATDFRDGFTWVRIDHQAQKGNHQAWTKNRKVRDIPVPAFLAAMVKAHVQANGLGALFPGSTGKPYCSYESVGTRITQLAAEVGLDGFSAHQFRHMFATERIQLGERTANVSKWMGDTERVVTDRYHHVTTDASDRCRAMGDQIGA
jgi:integrase